MKNQLGENGMGLMVGSLDSDRFEFERRCREAGACRVAGVDEAGRGPLAGPVTAAAVVLPGGWEENGLPVELEGLNDSKQLTRTRREAFYEFLTRYAGVAFAIESVSSQMIDELNILRAAQLAMRAAVGRLEPAPDHLLIDGLAVPDLRCAQTPIVKGDARSYSIAAASVLAKVTRDRMMDLYDDEYPGYGFRQHRGYGTPGHLEAIARLGPCPIHRRSFAPFRAAQLEFWAGAGERFVEARLDG